MTRSGYRVLYHPAVKRVDIKKLVRASKQQVKSAIEQKLTTNPATFGIPLRGTLKEYWKLRVGQYRIVYRIERKEVYVLVIAHRSAV